MSAFPSPSVSPGVVRADPSLTSTANAVAARRVARVVAIGAAAAMIAAAPYRTFELDRFFVPKEGVLLCTAAIACWLAAPLARDETARRGPPLDRLIDGALATYLAASVAGAVFASSGWLAVRAVAISGAGAVLFWAARAAARRGAGPTILGALVAAVALAAATALAQAYGVKSDYFSINRAPGGTFGNRNFVAHLCAIGLPLAAYVTLRARRVAPAIGAVLTALTLGAMLVLSRSRGAWIAGAASAVPFAIGLVRAGARAGAGPAVAGVPTGGLTDAWRPRAGRVALLAVALGAGAVAALGLPNVLDWKSDSPYLDSVKGVVDYRGGSGHGRLEQWENSLHLVAQRPVLGVGPGNWSVHYPAVAPPGDPSLTEDRTTANPWPSSDWVAVLSERGIVGFVALAAVVLGLALVAHRGVWGAVATDPGLPPNAPARALAGGALGGVLAATLIAGAFDAVLLLAAPAAVVWPALGALSELAEEGRPDRAAPSGFVPHERTVAAGRRQRIGPAVARGGALVLALAAALAIAHAAAMALYEDGGATAVRTAAGLAPGDYRIRSRAATLALGRGDCAAARAHAAAAHAMAPAAGAPRRVLASCRRR